VEQYDSTAFEKSGAFEHPPVNFDSSGHSYLNRLHMIISVGLPSVLDLKRCAIVSITGAHQSADFLKGALGVVCGIEPDVVWVQTLTQTQDARVAFRKHTLTHEFQVESGNRIARKVRY